ncbi:hypothetical protein HZS61_006155 [Fusarium oxysporum f. sp. conglutinans]|uniref:FAD-dependent oxidoreductase 2 FAD-binding domain-containing protein n=1 Tax=Fusarium oxysporum f. sp. conglutinans TaxID=100902 RepID=A0A8H6LDC9_FUSOX|nr:hypothetical protein HZS61_006115 [Fusarium oxysporum f. sp. conglutinans]KAF6515021.1 hypothetical protein HZS61_006155 [Fusarium oxysporum f. sp. conglutinans]
MGPLKIPPEHVYCVQAGKKHYELFTTTYVGANYCGHCGLANPFRPQHRARSKTPAIPGPYDEVIEVEDSPPPRPVSPASQLLRDRPKPVSSIGVGRTAQQLPVEAFATGAMNTRARIPPPELPSSPQQGPSLRVFFPIGSVPTRSMIAFFRDRDPAGRSEPEGMESTSPSTNDVDVLSSSTLAVASLATPAPSLQEETPHEEVEHQYLWRCFPDYVWSQRVRDTPSWVWGFGYDVEDSSGGRRWVCRRCIQNKNPKPRSFAEKGIQNANAHLFKGHGIRAPPDKTKSAAEKKAEKLKVKDQRSIAEVMKLDTRLPREQDIANSLVKGFDRKHFQRLLLEWIIEENHAFSVCEQGRLRQIFEYLNPLVKITDANITRTTIRRKVLSAYEMHKDKVVAALKQSCGLIHVSFDGWKSGNRHSLYGIACFFRDENSQPRKLALGVPELRTRHFGHNIAAEILDVLDAYGIQDKIGYFTLDNAESNDKAMEVIGGELGFVGSRRRGRCFGHTLNLSAKALLFGHNVEAFEEQLSGEAALSEAEHTLWRRKGPVGKLHNLVVDVRRSDQLTYLLRSIQRSEFDLSSDPRIRARQPVDLIIDNDTRWLSQLYMIRRAIILRPFIEQLVLKHRQQWEQDNRSKRTGNLRKSAREPRICLEENQLTVNDWVVLEHLAKLLGFYEDAVKTLEGDGQQRKRKGGWVGSYGNVWEVIQGFEFLLEVLEDYKQLASEIPDAEHFRINVNLGWEKLNKYYSRLDETPIYYTALALHPAFRWGYFENEWKDNTEWVMKAKQMVREVWESDYRHLQVVRSPVDDEPVAKRQRKYYNPFQAYCERTRPVLGYGLVKEEATLSDDINEGAGAAGLAAAAAVHDEGRRVIVIEKEDHVGGTTFGSGGCMWMPNNLCMQELGIEDSTVQAECYISAVEKATRPALAEDTARQALRNRWLKTFLTQGPEMMRYFRDQGFR